MGKNKKKKQSLISNDVIKAIHKGSRELQREINGGLQFVSTHKVPKNKKTYDRNNNKKELSNELDNSFAIFTNCNKYFYSHI